VSAATQGPREVGSTVRDESLIDNLKRLVRETSLLLRQELELARAEITQKLRGLGVGGALLIVAALLAIAALATLTACLILALTLVLAAWLAALIVTAIYLLGALLFALIGRSRITRALPPVPEQTIQTLKEDIEWLKIRTKSSKP